MNTISTLTLLFVESNSGLVNVAVQTITEIEHKGCRILPGMGDDIA